MGQVRRRPHGGGYLSSCAGVARHRLSGVSVAVLYVQLGLALGGLVLIVLDLLRFFALLR
jgi:hypothetical protein